MTGRRATLRRSSWWRWSSVASLVSASPAGAHGLGGLKPTNYETVLQLGDARRCAGSRPHHRPRHASSSSPTPVAATWSCSGTTGEPYLRIGPDGVFENIRSPATYLNRSATISQQRRRRRRPTPRAAPGVATSVVGGTTARWHDHRTHFMATDDPPEVRARPRTSATSSTTGSSRCASGTSGSWPRGQLVYVPPPSPWPWVVGRGRCSRCSSSWRRARTRGARCSSVVLALLTVTELVARRSGCGARRPRRSAPSWPRARTRWRASCSGVLGLGWIWRKGVRVGGADGAGGRHLPVRRRRSGRRHDARQLAGPEHAPGVGRAAPGELTLGLGAGLAVARARGCGSTAPAARGAAPAAASPRRPSPVELGAPRVVVGLHLDGGVRDLVVEQQHPGLVEDTVRVGVARRPSRARWRRPSPT